MLRLSTAEPLASKGCKVTKALAHATAIMREACNGRPVIGILGEYDALPGLSQEAGLAEERSLVPGPSVESCSE